MVFDNPRGTLRAYVRLYFELWTRQPWGAGVFLCRKDVDNRDKRIIINTVDSNRHILHPWLLISVDINFFCRNVATLTLKNGFRRYSNVPGHTAHQLPILCA